MIETEGEYQAALDRAWRLKERVPRSLVLAIEAYEDEHYPMDPPSLWARLAQSNKTSSMIMAPWARWSSRTSLRSRHCKKSWPHINGRLHQ